MFIKEFSNKTGLSIDTLRYYEEEKLLMPARNEKNYRIYSEEDFCWVQLLLKMKQTGMTLRNMKEFARLQKLGDTSLPDRMKMLDRHLEALYEQQANLAETISFVGNKWIHTKKGCGIQMKMKKLKLKITVDRPIGYKDKFGNTYPINYGFVSGIIGGDDEEQDVYIISSKVDEPLTTFTGELIATITRKDDVEEKWIATSPGEQLSLEEMTKKVYFIEQYFDSEIELID